MDESFYKQIAYRIKEKRFKRGYSQSFMATELGISQNTYSRNERSIKKMPLDRLYRIAAILNTPVVMLLGG